MALSLYSVMPSYYSDIQSWIYHMQTLEGENGCEFPTLEEEFMWICTAPKYPEDEAIPHPSVMASALVSLASCMWSQSGIDTIGVHIPF